MNTTMISAIIYESFLKDIITKLDQILGHTVDYVSTVATNPIFRAQVSQRFVGKNDVSLKDDLYGCSLEWM